MNNFNFIRSSNAGGKHINKSILPQRKDGLKQIILKITFLILPIILVLAIAVTSVILIEDNHYVSQIKNFRSIWYNSSNNVSDIRDKNQNFAGWISVADTDFDYPIFNSSYKKCSFYIDEHCDIENGKNLILRTPEKENKEIHTCVLYFKDINFYKRHPLIEINTDYDKSDYLVFASLYLDLQDIERFVTQSGDNPEALIKEFSDKSFLRTSFEISNEDDFLSIISSQGDTYFLVLARRVRKGEEIDISHASAGDIANHP